MYKIKLREKRGRTMTDWADCSHSFSYAQYFDPFNMGFSDLRVINDNIVRPEGGFNIHAQANMEVINMVFSGELEYKAYPDYSKVLSKGDVQLISTGWGLEHGEFNASDTEFLHFLQIWILPYKKDVKPNILIKNFDKELVDDELKLIVSGSGEDDSLKINQDTNIYKATVMMNRSVSYDLPPNRKVWIQIISGAVEINSNILEAGDGIAIVDERGYLYINGVDERSDILVFSLRNLTI